MAPNYRSRWKKRNLLNEKKFKIDNWYGGIIEYVNNNFDNDSKILDIGCGRGKILGHLNKRLRLQNQPLGIDIINHKDKDKRIKFKKIDAVNFFLNNKIKFDLILIKQTIHLLSLDKIKKLISLCKKNLRPGGKIFILTLDTDKNELPSFKLMKIYLKKSLKRDKKILDIIKQSYPYSKKFFFKYKVSITKKEYIKMIERRFISTLLFLTNKELLKGIKQHDLKYKDIIKFEDKLICLIL